MSITEARAQAAEAVAEARNHVENFPITEGDAVRVTRLADVIESLLAALPETPTTDDRDEIAQQALTMLGFFRPWQVTPGQIENLRRILASLATSRPSPPTEEPPRTVTFANERQVEALFAESSDHEMAFVNAINEHLIVGLSEDGECFYQGVPEALNEEGTEVDPRRGWLRNLREAEWPLTLMVKAQAAARVGGEGL